MTPELSETLCSVAEGMASFPSGWWIIGSAAVALHGIDAGTVHDVDLLIEAGLVEEVFDRLGVVPLAMPPDSLFRSTAFARWNALSVAVELMAGFEVAVCGEWQRIELRSRQQIITAAGMLFVPDRQELLDLFRLFGRTKDGPRIRALAASLATSAP